MLRLALVCLAAALIAAFVSLAGIAGEFSGAAKMFFFVFLALGVLSFVAHVLRRRSAWY